MAGWRMMEGRAARSPRHASWKSPGARFVGGRRARALQTDEVPPEDPGNSGVERWAYEPQELWRQFTWTQSKAKPPTPREAYERLARFESSPPETKPRWGKLERHHATLASLGMHPEKQIAKPMEVRAALPQGHGGQGSGSEGSGGEGWPCVVALPDEPGKARTQGSGIEQLVGFGFPDDAQCICAAVESNDYTWFVDGPYSQHESFFTQVVLPYLRREFNATSFHLIGLRQAGWAAVSLLTRFPRLISSAVAFDSPLMVSDMDKSIPGMMECVGSERVARHHSLPSNAADPHVASRLSSEQCSELGRVMLMEGPTYDGHAASLANILGEKGAPFTLERSTRRLQSAWNSGWLPLAFPFLARAIDCSPL